MTFISRKVSLKDIARMAGVSTATVSRVINDNGRFSEKTRQKVEAIISEYDYEPNKIAKGLRARKTNTIGILVPDIINTFFSSVVQALETKLFTKGYTTIICNIGKNPELLEKYCKMLNESMVDGVIVIGWKLEVANVLDNSIPHVYIEYEEPGYASVGSTNEAGAYEATKYLASLVSDISIISKVYRFGAMKERMNGYKKALREDKTLTGQTFSYTGDSEELKSFLKSKSMSGEPFGIFAVNDNIATQVLMLSYQLGIKVPEQMKLVGFDDAPVSKLCYPQLTTVQQDIDRITEQTCDNILRLINGKRILPEKMNVKIPTKLIIRGTT